MDVELLITVDANGGTLEFRVTSDGGVPPDEVEWALVRLATESAMEPTANATFCTDLGSESVGRFFTAWGRSAGKFTLAEEPLRQ